MAVSCSRLQRCGLLIALVGALVVPGCAFPIGGSGESELTFIQRDARTILQDHSGIPLRLPKTVPDDVIDAHWSEFPSGKNDGTQTESVEISFRRRGRYIVCYSSPENCGPYVGSVVRQVPADQEGPITVIRQGRQGDDTSLVTGAETNDVLYEYWTHVEFVTNPDWLVELAD